MKQIIHYFQNHVCRIIAEQEMEDIGQDGHKCYAMTGLKSWYGFIKDPPLISSIIGNVLNIGEYVSQYNGRIFITSTSDQGSYFQGSGQLKCNGEDLL